MSGEPNGMKELVVLRSHRRLSTPDEPSKSEISLKTLDQTADGTILDIADACSQDVLYDSHDQRHLGEREELKEIALSAPNIAMNVRSNKINQKELQFWLIIGILLETFMLVFPAFATYRWKWVRKGVSVPGYAYPCFLAGSLIMFVGLLACGHVIEGCTTKHTFSPVRRHKTIIQRIIRLQMECTVSSQQFSSFVMFNDAEDMAIRTCRLNDKDYK